MAVTAKATSGKIPGTWPKEGIFVDGYGGKSLVLHLHPVCLVHVDKLTQPHSHLIHRLSSVVDNFVPEHYCET